jgi:hypothetical protein
MTTPYKPQSAFELFLWTQSNCVPCVRFVMMDPDRTMVRTCELCLHYKSSVFTIDDRHYPHQWIYKHGVPICMARVVEDETSPSA